MSQNGDSYYLTQIYNDIMKENLNDWWNHIELVSMSFLF